jgi:hypothetical protein
MDAKPWSPFLALFGSLGTLICCALPAILVAFGAGASLASLLGNFPQLIWFSEQKALTFGVAGLFIAFGYLNLWRGRNAPCPIDPRMAQACRSGKKISLIVLIISSVLFLVGAGFAFLLPMFY